MISNGLHVRPCLSYTSGETQCVRGCPLVVCCAKIWTKSEHRVTRYTMLKLQKQPFSKCIASYNTGRPTHTWIRTIKLLVILYSPSRFSLPFSYEVLSKLTEMEIRKHTWPSSQTPSRHWVPDRFLSWEPGVWSRESCGVRGLARSQSLPFAHMDLRAILLQSIWLLHSLIYN